MSPFFGGKEKNKAIEKCDALYAWHKDAIYKMALGAVGGDKEWALALLEECMEAACENIDKFDDERSDKSSSILTAILHGLISNIHIAARQKLGLHEKGGKFFATKKDKFDVDQVLIRNELTADLAKYVGKLTNFDKQLIFMRFFMGLSEAETAKYLGYDLNETENKIFLVKQKIAKMIKEG